MNRREALKTMLGLAGGALLMGTPFRLLARVLERPVERLYWAMGTTVRFQVYHADPAQARQAIRQAMQFIQQVQERMSVQQADSLLSRWNRDARGLACPLDELTARAIGQALAFRQESKGLFDPTVGAAVQALLKGQAVPPQREREVYWRSPGEVLEKSHPAVQLDLGGSAKGWAVDCAMEILQAHGVQAALVNAGGDLRVFGAPPGEPAWPIGIRHPDRPDQLLTVLYLHNQAIATSGDYESRDNALLVDPRSLQPVQLGGSVSVVAPTCARADAWSTALSVSPDPRLLPADLRCIIARRNGGALIVHMDPDLKILQTRGGLFE